MVKLYRDILLSLLRRTLISGASFAEYFYGLSRKNNKTNQFGKSDYYCSLVTLVFLPYAYEKLKTYMDKLQLKVDGLNSSKRSKYEGQLKVYKNMMTIFETAKLLQILGMYFFNTITSLFM